MDVEKTLEKISKSPSARREWIEILASDYNRHRSASSPSARRERIEIHIQVLHYTFGFVSLCEEGVD